MQTGDLERERGGKGCWGFVQRSNGGRAGKDYTENLKEVVLLDLFLLFCFFIVFS